jgi:tRNA threonylcarbamoyladenosine biosynthesis protein TsaB
VSSEDPLILAVDTATACSTVALTTGDVHGGSMLASISLNSKITHSRRLLTAIEWVLQESDVALGDIDGFAVGLGPGSFTGLRIGMATMKGLAVALDKPLLGVSTLDGLALNCSGELPLCVLLDARKKEVYRAWYAKDTDGIYRATCSIQALTPTAMAQEITSPCLLVGDGTIPYGSFLQEKTEEQLFIAPLPQHYPNAVSLAFLCCEKFKNNETLDIESAVPLYVRASDAELSLKQKNKVSQ